jgi:hypothetical protein
MISPLFSFRAGPVFAAVSGAAQLLSLSCLPSADGKERAVVKGWNLH